jgi:hypothetical protein
LLAIAISCTVDGIDGETSMLDSVTAPSKVVAFYNITQDNTGSVTITQMEEQSLTISIMAMTLLQLLLYCRVKAQLTFIKKVATLLKIVAIGITGLKMETTQNLVVSFREKKLDVVITNDLVISKK